MMKLKYSPKRTITTAELFDACDPPLTFEVKTKPGHEWAKLDREFDKNGAKDASVAKELISMAFLTVSDGGEIYSIETIDQVEMMGQAIEDNNPGEGNNFLCAMAWSFGRNYYTQLEEILGNSQKPLAQLNGSGQEKSKVKES